MRLAALPKAVASWIAAHRQDVRDAILFASGLAIVAHEVFLEHADRPGVLMLAAAMMGLASVLRQNGSSGR